VQGNFNAILDGADIAILMTGPLDVGGIAYGSLSAYRIPFGVVATNGPPYTFGHELSHIFGANHDDATLSLQTGSTRVNPVYSRGLLTPNDQRTIMA